MRIAEEDKRKDVPRPLAQCGAYVAPGNDARWRGVPVLSELHDWEQRVDTLDARAMGRETR